MKGDRSLAASWPVAKKLWREATVDRLDPSGGSFSAKSASFQVGEHSGQVACLSKPQFFLWYI